jgi:ribosomal protein L37AE/L43A
MDELICPGCESDEDLSGERDGEVIRITCARCDLTWDRDLTPRCETCGRTDVRSAAQAVWEKSRGTQLSIVSVHTVHLCPDCDAEKLARVRESNTPLPPDDNPAAGMR